MENQIIEFDNRTKAKVIDFFCIKEEKIGFLALPLSSYDKKFRDINKISKEFIDDTGRIRVVVPKEQIVYFRVKSNPNDYIIKNE